MSNETSPEVLSAHCILSYCHANATASAVCSECVHRPYNIVYSRQKEEFPTFQMPHYLRYLQQTVIYRTATKWRSVCGMGSTFTQVTERGNTLWFRCNGHLFRCYGFPSVPSTKHQVSNSTVEPVPLSHPLKQLFLTISLSNNLWFCCSVHPRSFQDSLT